jgi:hypothetical protein
MAQNDLLHHWKNPTHGDGAKQRAITPVCSGACNGADAPISRYAPAALCLRRRLQAHRSHRRYQGLASSWIAFRSNLRTRNSSTRVLTIALGCHPGVAARVIQRLCGLVAHLTSRRSIGRIHGLPTGSIATSGQCLGQSRPARASAINNIKVLASLWHRLMNSVHARERSAGQVLGETQARAQ